VAAKQLGMRLVGFEFDATHASTARQRLATTPVKATGASK
jgi:hypothetical protein